MSELWCTSKEWGAQQKVGGTSAASTTVQNTSIKKEVFVRGMRTAGNSKYYAFMYFTPVAILVLGYLISETNGGVLLWALIALIFGVIAKIIFKQSIMYDEVQQAFVYNAHSHLKFTMKTLKLTDIKSIRLRYVKIGYGTSRASLNDIGKYHVISLDAETPNQSLKVWFPKDGNMEEFIPALEYAVQQSGRSIPINRKDELMKWVEFETELENA